MQEKDSVIAAKDFGGVAREAIRAGIRGRVTSAPFGERAEVTFDVDSFWHGHRQIKVRVDSDEVAVLR